MLYCGITKLSCIVGQYLQTLGVSQTVLRNHASVGSVGRAVPPEAGWLLNGRNDSLLAGNITDTNDGTLHQIRREAKLKKLFAQGGVNLTFTGRYRDATMQAKRALKASAAH